MKKVTYALMMSFVCLLLFSFTENSNTHLENLNNFAFNQILVVKNMSSNQLDAVVIINNSSSATISAGQEMTFSVPGNSMNVSISFPGPFGTSGGMADASYRLVESTGKFGQTICTKEYIFDDDNEFHTFNCDETAVPQDN